MNLRLVPDLPAKWEEMTDEERAAARLLKLEDNRSRLVGVPRSLRDRANEENERFRDDGWDQAPFAISLLIDEHERRMREEPGYRAVVEQELAGEKEAEVQERISRLQARGVPAKDVEAIARDDLRETKAYEAARRFRTERGLLVLAGPPGTGKTTAAAWVIAQEDSAEWITAVHLSRRSSYDDAAMLPLERCSLLVIDDVGAEYGDAKGYFVQMLDGLINERYAHLRPTVITTNLPAKEFKARYGERIADRIREVGRFVEIADPSMRKRDR